MLGDCYYKAYKYQEAHPDVTLVHGLVKGQGKLQDIIYNHSWCKDGDTIIHMTLKPKLQKKTINKNLYYLIGDIKTTFRYSYQDRIEKSLEIGTYGPWESELLKSQYIIPQEIRQKNLK